MSTASDLVATLSLQSTIDSDSEHLSVYSLLKEQAERTPDAIAVASGRRTSLTYSGLMAQVDSVTRGLKAMGIGCNDRVALVLPNGPEMAVAFLGVVAGATCAPLNPAYREREFDFYLSDLKAKGLIVQSGMDTPATTVAHRLGIAVMQLSPMPEVAAGVFRLAGEVQSGASYSKLAQSEDIALVLHTSGTTSRPKIVPLTQKNVCTSANNIRVALGLSSSDRYLNVMPLFHIHGLMALFSSLTAGASVFCARDAERSDFFKCMEEFHPSWYTASPAIHQAVLAQAKENRHTISRRPLRFIRSASSFLPAPVRAELEEVFNAPVIEAYGMTEGAHQISSNPLPPGKRKAGSVGLGTGTETGIIDPAGDFLAPTMTGEIVIRGANTMQGYENNPETNAASFTGDWLRTGDAGYLDADGYLFITGRLKEIIDRGGEKISPQEVDDVLMQHPAVAQVAAFALPHPALGEEVAAAIVLREGTSATENEIRHFAFERLTHTKVPQRIIIVDAIPKGPTGKFQRIGLAKKLGLTSDQSTSSTKTDYVAPQTPVETKLAAIWAQILHLDKIGIRDNFFDLGGDSMLAAKLTSQFCEEFQVNLPIQVLFQSGTIAELAARIEREASEVRHCQGEKGAYSHLVELQIGQRTESRIFCFPHSFGMQGEYSHFFRLARHMGSDYSFYGLQVYGPDGVAQAHDNIESLAAAYVKEIQTLQPKGPYFLLGECSGGPETYETARQLREEGETVALLALMETRGPYVSRRYFWGALVWARLIDHLLYRFVGSRWWKPLNYALVGAAFHLRKAKQLEAGKAWRYLLEKAIKAVRAVPHLFEIASPSESAAQGMPESERQIGLKLGDARQIYRKNWRWPYGGRITLIVSNDWYGLDSTFGWADVALDGVEVHTIPGNHNSYMLEHDRIVAEKLTACIEKAKKKLLGSVF